MNKVQIIEPLKKSYIMQLSNLQLYVTNYHLQLCFVIFITTHHPFQSITIIATMIQLIYDY